MDQNNTENTMVATENSEPVENGSENTETTETGKRTYNKRPRLTFDDTQIQALYRILTGAPIHPVWSEQLADIVRPFVPGAVDFTSPPSK